MKRQADKGRSEREFQVGDQVYLKLQPYVQSSLAPRSNMKLAFKFFGPFRILQRIGSVAYELELPAGSTIHPVFHVSQLKQARGTQTVSPTLPTDASAFQFPERVLQRRMTSGDQPVLQGLIKWSGMPEELSTWENLEVLRHRFPLAPTWGQVVSQEEGDVSSSTTAVPGPRPRRESRPNKNVTGPEWSK
jgi:hypothetical protein